MERPGSLAVKANVLGEGLGDAEPEPLLNEVVDSPSVGVEVTGCETLVRAVEEGEVGAGAHDGGYLLPLGLSRIDTSGVVGAGVEENDGALRGGFEGADHALEV